MLPFVARPTVTEPDLREYLFQIASEPPEELPEEARRLAERLAFLGDLPPLSFRIGRNHPKEHVWAYSRTQPVGRGNRVALRLAERAVVRSLWDQEFGPDTQLRQVVLLLWADFAETSRHWDPPAKALIRALSSAGFTRPHSFFTRSWAEEAAWHVPDPRRVLAKTPSQSCWPPYKPLDQVLDEVVSFYRVLSEYTLELPGQWDHGVLPDRMVPNDTLLERMREHEERQQEAETLFQEAEDLCRDMRIRAQEAEAKATRLQAVVNRLRAAVPQEQQPDTTPEEAAGKQVVTYAAQGRKRPALDFIDSLKAGPRMQCLAELARLPKYLALGTSPRVEKLNECARLYYLRVRCGREQYRLFFAQSKDSPEVLVLTGYHKKGQKVDRSEVNKADALLRNGYLTRGWN